MIFDLQKASMWKRISAFLFDAIMMSMLAILLALILSSALHYDSHQALFNEAYQRYYDEYGLNDELLATDPASLTAEQTAQIDAASRAIAADPDAVHAYSMVINLQVLIVTFALLITFLLWEFAVPLLLGNGQTLGKKIFGVGVMHLDGVQVGHVALFVRAILGKYAVGTMPYAMCALYVFSGVGSPLFLLIGLVLLVVQALMLILSRENALLHDKMAFTVTVDLASQMIFRTRDELIAYKKKLHAEKAAAQDY